MEFYTNRLHIRPVKTEDKNPMFRYRSDPGTNKFLSLVPESEEDVADFIRKTSSIINVPGTWFQFVIIEKTSELLIGDIGIHFLESPPENNHVEIGYTLDRQFRGKGYATEALTAIIDFLFTGLHKNRITASIDPANAASVRLIERLGFQKKAHHIKSLFFHGEWVDDVIYGISSDEWNEEHKPEIQNE